MQNLRELIKDFKQKLEKKRYLLEKSMNIRSIEEIINRRNSCHKSMLRNKMEEESHFKDEIIYQTLNWVLKDRD